MSEVLLDAGAVTRCRRRVHLEHDPTARGAVLAPPDPTADQRIADARAHRQAIAELLRAAVGDACWVTVPAELPSSERVRMTAEALAQGAAFISGALLPADTAAGRRGGAELLVRTGRGYVPILVVRHRISDPGEGASTTPLTELDPDHARPDSDRKVRSHLRDQLRLVHVRELLRVAGHAEPGRARGGVIGLDADVVVWHDLDAPTFPGGASARQEYATRFADRVAVARAAATGAEPLAVPSRIVECKHCPWGPVCELALTGSRDVSLVVRGEDAMTLRGAGVSTVDDLAALDPASDPPISFTGNTFANTVALARAWLADLTVVRRVADVSVPRADIEVDVDMESFGDHGAYLWGALLTGVDIGVQQGYHAFATWKPVPTADEARSFAEFWSWFSDIRARAAARGLTFRAYCYNALAENRWLLSSTRRFAGEPGIPDRADVQSFVDSEEWVDLFRSVSESFLCTHGKGLKVIAPVAGFAWQDPEAGGEASMRWYREAVGLNGGRPDPGQRERLLRYNADDVRATYVLREWMSGP
ncbi:MAG: TM0106 family RecB-like putative nuclease, partial [Haloechinothrix sp.]